MIVNVSPPGKNMHGMVAYLRDTSGIHRDPHLVTGSMGYTGALEDPELAQLLADELDLPAMLNRDRVPDKGHVWNAAVVLDSKDGIKTIQEWKNITDDYMAKMAFDVPGVYWAAVNHGPNAAGQDHVHVLMNRVNFDGTLVLTGREKSRSAQAAWELEDSYGLTPLTSRRTGTGSRMYGKNDHRMSKREGREPRKVELERRVRAAAAGAHSQEEFISNLLQDDIRFRPRKDTNGKAVGYSVQPKGVPDKYWWAGSTLAADLSLPRLELWWAREHKNLPDHIKAVEELKNISSTAKFADPHQLADYSHQLSGALAAASQKTEPVPGPLARESRKVGALAQTRTYQRAPKPPALSAGLLFLQCKDPAGPVGQAVMIQQMLAASRAVLDAHLARARVAVPSKEGTSVTQQAQPEDEVLESAVTIGATSAAMMIETHARNRTERKGWEADLPTADWFRKSRIQNDVAEQLQRFRPPPTRITPENVQKLSHLARQTDIAMPPEVISQMDDAEAQRMIRTLEFARGPATPDPVSTTREQEKQAEDFLEGLERRAAERGSLLQPEAASPASPVLDAKDAELLSGIRIPEQWKSGHEPVTKPQSYTLRQQGVDPAGLSKAEASLIISGDAKTPAEAKARTAAAAVHTSAAANTPKKYSRGR